MPDERDTVKTVALGRAAEAAADPLVGQSFGSYKVVKLLGEGGMGAVYLGEHPVIGSRVAIKMLHARYADDEALVERFFNEARAVNLIGHENIVQVLDLSRAHGRHYFVMEFLAGNSLEQELKATRLFTAARAGPVVLQCCKALEAAHRAGIIHRDLKPDNVFLVRRGDRADFVKLVDFGIAKLLETGTGHTQAGTFLGTPAYASPEQAAGDTDIDARSDVYSLGVMFFRMVTGRLPFDGSTRSNRSILLAHLHEPPPSPRSIRADIPEEIESIVLCALEKDPADRFQSMAEMHSELSSCLHELGLSTELPEAAATDPTTEVVGGTTLRAHATPSPRSHPGRGRTPSPRRAVSSPGKRPVRRRAARIAAFSVLGLAALGGGLAIGLRRDKPAPVNPARQRPAATSLIAEPAPEPPPVQPAVTQPPAAAPPAAAPTPVADEAPPAEPAVREEPKRNPRVAAVKMVQLRLATNPQADFVVAWSGGSRAGRTPMVVQVPKGAEVHIRFAKAGYPAADVTLTAAEDRVVFRSLSR